MNTSEGATRLGHNALIQNMIPELHVNRHATSPSFNGSTAAQI